MTSVLPDRTKMRNLEPFAASDRMQADWVAEFAVVVADVSAVAVVVGPAEGSCG